MNPFQKGTISLAAIFTIAFAVGPSHSRAQFFTVAPDSTSTLEADEVFLPGPATFLESVGLPFFNTDDVDAISFGHRTGEFLATRPLQFSVTHFADGAPGSAVAAEGLGNFDSAADIYVEDGAGSNTLLWDGDGIPNPGSGSKGQLGLTENMGFAGTELNGWHTGSPRLGRIWFSIDATVGGPNGSDIFWSPAGNGFAATNIRTVWATAAQLGLDVIGPNTDDIDGLAVFEDGVPGFTSGDIVIYSLKVNSFSLTSNMLGDSMNYTGSDVFRVDGPGGGPTLFRSHQQLGITSLELDALDLTPVIIPEPASVTLLALGMTAVLCMRRRYTRT